MLLFADTISNRLHYIVNFIAKETGIEHIELTQDSDKFQSFKGPKLNYSNKRISEIEYWIKPHSILFEKNIQEQTIQCFDFNDSKAFFKTEGDFPFDVFAATFYLLSRYEEYLPHSKDMYGRYAHINSLAFNENFLTIPLVNQWLLLFKKILLQKFPFLLVKHNSFNFQPTYDIDEAYAYKHKGWFRNAGGAARDFLKGKWNKVTLRKRVLNNTIKDTYDSYEWMNELHEQHNLKPYYFFLVPAKNGKYEKNILPTNKAMQLLIQQHAAKYTLGIHPSWQSGDKASLILEEINTLEKITGQSITTSRQHFIRLTLPDTYWLLIDASITDDYSMGYGSINGFRASVASSFFWYDLAKEKQTNLLLHPFCYMEANSFYEQKMSSQEALDEMVHYLNEVKKVNGTLITIWHNTFLGTAAMFTGWKEVYQQFIKEASR